MIFFSIIIIVGLFVYSHERKQQHMVCETVGLGATRIVWWSEVRKVPGIELGPLGGTIWPVKKGIFHIINIK